MHPSKLIIIKSCIHEYSSSITETPQVRLEQASSHLSSLVLAPIIYCGSPSCSTTTWRTLIVWRAQRIHTYIKSIRRSGDQDGWMVFIRDDNSPWTALDEMRVSKQYTRT